MCTVESMAARATRMGEIPRTAAEETGLTADVVHLMLGEVERKEVEILGRVPPCRGRVCPGSNRYDRAHLQDPPEAHLGHRDAADHTNEAWE
jgi:hypothetical protein